MPQRKITCEYNKNFWYCTNKTREKNFLGFRYIPRCQIAMSPQPQICEYEKIPSRPKPPEGLNKNKI